MANWQEKQNKNSFWFNFVAFVSDRMDITHDRYLYTYNFEKNINVFKLDLCTKRRIIVKHVVIYFQYKVLEIQRDS